MRLFFLIFLSLVALPLLFSCNKTKGPEDREQPPKQVSATPLVPAFSDNAPTLFLRENGKSSIPWQDWDQQAFQNAKEHNKMVFAFVSSNGNVSDQKFLKELGNNESIRKQLLDTSVPVLIDARLHPQMLQEAIRLSSELGKIVEFPFFIWYSADGHPVSWNSLRPYTTLDKIVEFDNGLNMVFNMWNDSVDYVNTNSFNAAKTRTANFLKTHIEQTALVGNLDDLTTASRNLSSLYNPQNQQLDLAPPSVHPSIVTYLIRSSYISENPEFIAKRSRKAGIEITNANLHSPIRDVVDGTMFDGTANKESRLPILNKTLSLNADYAKFLIENAKLAEQPEWLHIGLDILENIPVTFGTSDEKLINSEIVNTSSEDLTNYYLFDYSKIKENLSSEEFALAEELFRFREKRDLKSYGLQPESLKEKRLLAYPSQQQIEKAAKKLLVSTDLFNNIRSKLRKIRQSKRQPNQQALFLSLNDQAALISALSSAWRATGKKNYLADAEKYLSQINSDLVPDDLSSIAKIGWSQSKPINIPANANSLAKLLTAQLDIYTATADPKFLTQARKTALRIQSQYLSEDSPMITELPSNQTLTSLKISHLETHHTTSTYALLTSQLHRLQILQSDTDLHPLKSALENFKPKPEHAERFSLKYSGDFLAALQLLTGKYQLIVSEPRTEKIFPFLQKKRKETPNLDKKLAIDPETAAKIFKKPVKIGKILQMTESGTLNKSL